MTNEVEKPQPVDNSHLDAGIAARNAKAEAEKPVEKDSIEQKEESQTVEQKETEGSAASEADDAAAQKPKNKGVGKRIDELTREKYDAQREAQYWREQAMRNQQAEPRQEPQKKPDSNGEPTIEQFDFDMAAYQRAWYSWKRDEERKAEQAETETKSRQEIARKYQESVQAFAEANPDFYEVFHDRLPVTKEMAEAIAESDNPAAVAYFLGKNPQEAEKIVGLSPAAVNRAIGRIEAQLAVAADPPRQVTPKTVTQAPPPVTTLSGAPAVVKSLDDMSMAEYDAQRRKERRARGLR